MTLNSDETSRDFETGVLHRISSRVYLAEWFGPGELGSADAYCNLGMSYDIGRGVEEDKKKAKHYYELAAMNGDVKARHNLGHVEGRAGNNNRAKKHFILAAKAGFKKSLDVVKQGYMNGIVTKDEYANFLRAYQQRHDEMISEARDKFRAFYHSQAESS